MNSESLDFFKKTLDCRPEHRPVSSPRLLHVLVDRDPSICDPLNIKFTAVAGDGLEIEEDGSPVPIPDYNPLPGICLRPEFCAAMWCDSPEFRIRQHRCTSHWVTCDAGDCREIIQEWTRLAAWMKSAGSMLLDLPSPLLIKKTLCIEDPVERWLITLHDTLQPSKLSIPFLDEMKGGRGFREGIKLGNIQFGANVISAAQIDDIEIASVNASRLLLNSVFELNSADYVPNDSCATSARSSGMSRQDAGTISNDLNEDAKHSTDFRSVNWYGELYQFSPMQAACIRLLWLNWQQGTPIVGEPAILEAADSLCDRLRDVFGKDHPAWGTLIQSAGKGAFKLVAPTNLS